MRSHSLLLVLVAMSMCACAAMPADHPPLPRVDDLPTSANGSWVALKSRSGVVRSGELLAVENDGMIYIQLLPTLNPTAVSPDTLKSAHLVKFNPEASGIAGLAFLGTLTTISNGWYLVFTAPAWILVGTGATTSRSHEPHMVVPPKELNELKPYARFPAGMPAGFATTMPPPVVAKPKPAPPPGTPPEPQVAEKPKPKIQHFAMNIGGGVSFHENGFHDLEQSGFGIIAGVDFETRAAFLGTRFSLAHREVTGDSFDPEWQESGESFDLALLFGLHGQIKSVHGALGIGPATYGARIDDVFDLKFSLAYQAELTANVARNVGLGGLLAYNQNEFRDFYVVALGLRFVVW